MLFIIGHEIKMTRNGQEMRIEDFTSKELDTIVEDINYCILQGDEGGSITTDDTLLDVEWDIVPPTLSYLQEKLEILEKENSVLLEHNSKIYKFFFSEWDSGYIYDVFELFAMASGDTFSSTASGICKGSAKDAIEMAIGESI